MFQAYSDMPGTGISLSSLPVARISESYPIDMTPSSGTSTLIDWFSMTIPFTVPRTKETPTGSKTDCNGVRIISGVFSYRRGRMVV